jgi:hypothetical protein
LEGSDGALIEVLSQNLRGETEKTTKSTVRIAVIRPRFKLSTSRIQVSARSVLSSFEHGNEHPGFVKGEEFLDQLGNYELMKNDCTPMGMVKGASPGPLFASNLCPVTSSRTELIFCRDAVLRVGSDSYLSRCYTHIFHVVGAGLDGQ